MTRRHDDDEEEAAAAAATTSSAPSSPSSDASAAAAITTGSSSSFKHRAPAPAASKRKSRKSTHTLRKEEKQQLLCEMARLQAQMDKLRRRALGGGASQQTAAQTSFAAGVLQNALQQQLAHFADAQMLFSAIGMTQVVSPIAMPVRLGAERRERVATLAAMKDARLRASRAFLTRRCGALDPRTPFAEDQRFEAPNGDYCVVRCNILQFAGARSVRQVFDTLRFYCRHIEISMTERLGAVTIREDDDDAQAEDVHQNRLVGAAGGAGGANVLVETNTVLFSEFVERSGGGGGARGLIATDFVDEDALYPYRPAQRVRKDTSLILQVTSFMQPAAGGTAQKQEEELVVALTRWSHTRLHRASFPVPSAAIAEVREGTAKWCEAMMQSLRESLLAAT